MLLRKHKETIGRTAQMISRLNEIFYQSDNLNLIYKGDYELDQLDKLIKQYDDLPVSEWVKNLQKEAQRERRADI